MKRKDDANPIQTLVHFHEEHLIGMRNLNGFQQARKRIVNNHSVLSVWLNPSDTISRCPIQPTYDNTAATRQNSKAGTPRTPWKRLLVSKVILQEQQRRPVCHNDALTTSPRWPRQQLIGTDLNPEEPRGTHGKSSNSHKGLMMGKKEAARKESTTDDSCGQ